MKTNSMFFRKVGFVTLLVSAFALGGCSGDEEGSSGATLSSDRTKVVFNATDNSPDTIRVSCNTMWRATCEADWVRLAPTSASGDGMIALIVDNNEKPAARKATVHITAEEISTDIEVEQHPGAVYSIVFDTEAAVGKWQSIDKDGDGHGWVYMPMLGSACACSETMGYGQSGPYEFTPEDYFVSPKITVPADIDKITLTWSFGLGMDYQDPMAPIMEDTYKILVSESPITAANCSTLEPVYTEKGAYPFDEIKTKTLNLTGYAGKQIYVAFGHYDSEGGRGAMLYGFTINPTK